MTNVRPFWLPALAIIFVSLVALAEIDAGFSLWDEGFLWYGAQRVVAGEMPIRDFQAYDPARYYWSAAVMALSGSDGIVVTRLAAYLTQAIGLCALLLSVRADRIRHERRVALLIVLLMLLWMFPRHKLYDASACLVLIAGMAAWLRHPGHRQSFLLGILIGLVACIGRNHGLYGALASAGLLIAVSDGGQRIRTVFCFALGVVLGYSPLLLALVIFPEFAQRFVESITILFEIRATNLPIPVPWPWKLAPGASARDLLIGFHFVLVAIAPPLALIKCLSRGSALRSLPSTMVAAAFLSLPYAHFAFSRADINHLAQGILPTLVVLAIWMAKSQRWRRWSLGVVLASGAVVMLPMHPGWTAWREHWQQADIAGEKIRLPDSARLETDALQNVFSARLQTGESFFATPYWPGAYALRRTRSPTWEIYALVPRKPEFERQEIALLAAEKPRLVLLMGYPLDGLEQRRFKYTHPLMYEHIQSRFFKLPDEPNLAGVLLFSADAPKR